MYIPKLRTTEEVADIFKKRDIHTAITRTMIENLIVKKCLHSVRVGRNRLVNLDEVFYVLNCSQVELNIYADNLKKAKHANKKNPNKKMMSILEILKLFKDADSDTHINRTMLRYIARNKMVDFVKLSFGFIIDFNKLVKFFSPVVNCNTPKIMPKFRHYECCYHRINKYAGTSITWDKLHDIVHSGEVFCFYNGNRHVVNYDVVRKIVSSYNDTNVAKSVEKANKKTS